MNTAAIENWLRQHCGLESSSLGPGAVARAAQGRAAALGCTGPEEYLERLITSDEERQLLIDRVVVPETWFFRDRAATDAVASHAAGPWNDAHPGEVFRVLCVPCSTGEEPYSLAMAFAQAGWPSQRLVIEAVDISRENIAAARVGLYRKNSFRGADLLFRELYLEPAGAEVWRVRDELRASVRFSMGNLLAADFALGRGPYDAIFCRNLLIYFDRATQDCAIATLARLLAPGGWFAVGPAEPVLLFEHGFAALKIPAAFLLHRAPPRPAVAAPQRLRTKHLPLPLPPPAPVAKFKIVAEAEGRHQPNPKSAAPVAEDSLATIQILADTGRLAEAAARGTALLARGGATPELLYLLGVIADASSAPARAAEYYRKTLYLAPAHSGALMQLALQAENSGDLRAARTWRARAERTLAKEPVAPVVSYAEP